MSNKKATSQNSKAAPITKAKSNTSFQLPLYEKRALSKLVVGCIDRNDLDSYVGTNNSPLYIHRLKRRGLNIITHMRPMPNRDGKMVPCAKYCLGAGSLPKAKAFLGIK